MYLADEQLLKGKVALVVGGSRGIGREVVMSLAHDGAEVFFTYLVNERAAKLTIDEARKKYKRQVVGFQTNVRSEEDTIILFNNIRRRCGRLDILVYCAALGIFKPLLKMASLQLRRIFELNVGGFVLYAQCASRLMLSGGSVVAISSLGSQRYFKRYGAMGMAKASLEAAIRYLAVELASKNIRVNGVSAGPVDTEGAQVIPMYRTTKSESIRLAPTKRIGTARDISGVVRFLCSQDSEWVRGQVIVADGGLSLRVGNM